MFTEFSDTIEVDLLTTQHIVATATQILHVLDQRSGALCVPKPSSYNLTYTVYTAVQVSFGGMWRQPGCRIMQKTRLNSSKNSDRELYHQTNPPNTYYSP